MPQAKRAKRTHPAPPQPTPASEVKPDQEVEPPIKMESGATDSEDEDPALVDEEEDPGSSETTHKPASGFAGGYNALKSYNGQMYSGMSIGGSHTWNYDPGLWKETKEEPDRWKIDFETTKRRARKAPEGSGAPVGTEYHWYIVAHQYVKKVDANTYTTHLVGSKYKLAHKNANSNSWSIPKVKAQREREVFLLEDAKRRVEGLPPVLGTEKVKVAKHEKGQKTLDSLFVKSKKGLGDGSGSKRKREVAGIDKEVKTNTSDGLGEISSDDGQGLLSSTST